MTQVIKANGIDISKNDRGELLLTVDFRNLEDQRTPPEKQYSWMPQWDTIRELMFSAIVVEAMNTGHSKELDSFADSLRICSTAQMKLTGMLMGQMGIEG